MSLKNSDVTVQGKGYGVDTMESAPLAAELSVGGVPLSPSKRSELKGLLKAGQLDELVFEAVTFRDGANTNHTRFKAEELSAFAASFVGAPFLRNHDTRDIGSRDGTIIKSSLVASEFHQTVRLTTERGMKDFLDGVIDRFSIGWYFESVECSVCHQDWMGCSHWPGNKYDGQTCELIFVGPRGKETSAVNAPAVQGTRILEQLCQLKESSGMANEIFGGPLGADGSVKVVEPVAASSSTAIQPVQVDMAAELSAMRAQLDGERIERLISDSGLTPQGKNMVRLASKGHSPEYTVTLIEAQRASDGAVLDAHLVRGMRPVEGNGGVLRPGQAVQMETPLDRVQSAWNWMLGARDEPAPVPSLRSVRDLYHLVTGDYDYHGRFMPEWAQLAAATTTTMAGITVNALNKVIKMHYDNMATYRWYENIVDVSPHDGTTHNVQLITIDGIANLPIVAEGAGYTEANVGDSKESMSFVKRGHYVGITLEAIRRSDIQRLQAIPRALVQGAIRSRSAAIASIFTVNSAVGPTLADDGLALFHATHGNTAVTALGSDGVAWNAARTRIWEQVIPGTSKPLGLWPKFVLVPIELYDLALTLFGYGTGDVGKPGASFGQTVNPYGESRAADPRPVPIPVPDWTDATNWAYIADPRLQPVIHMAYANAPQGGSHAMPEIFEVTSETSGLMFSNDTLPVKIRDWWSYGVSTYVGIGNNIVAG